MKNIKVISVLLVLCFATEIVGMQRDERMQLNSLLNPRPEEKMFVCPIQTCNMTLKSTSEESLKQFLINHMAEMHHYSSDQKVQCPKCENYFAIRGLQVHATKAHEWILLSPTRCLICQKDLFSYLSYINHFKKHGV